MSSEELVPETDNAAVDSPEVAESSSPEVVEGSEDLAAGLDIGSQAVAGGEEAPAEYHEPVIRGKIDKFGTAWGTGRRKTSVARVRVTEGSGKITVNDRAFEEYFCIERDRELIMRVLAATEATGKVDIAIRVKGGGPTGQTGAVVLGIARALEAKNPSLHHALHEEGFLTRDSRMVERKKYGFKKARRSFQFSKR